MNPVCYTFCAISYILSSAASVRVYYAKCSHVAIGKRSNYQSQVFSLTLISQLASLLACQLDR